MIKTPPIWTCTVRHTLRQWYGHVHLLANRVLGQWFCAERANGSILWERRLSRPNTIVGIGAGVIAATEMRSDGPWTAGFGCYGIALDTGELLWTGHANGAWGQVLRALDRLPLFANDLRDAPLHVDGPECLCRSGRVLDMRSGRQIRRITKEQAKLLTPKEPESDAQVLYKGRAQNAFTKVRVAAGQWLSHKRFSRDTVPGFRLHLLCEDDTVRWTFDLGTTGYHMIQSNFYSYRYLQPWVYIVASEEPGVKPHPAKNRHVVPHPTIFHLLVLDVRNGAVVQDIKLGDQRFGKCRIEDVDQGGLLLSAEERELLCYARTGE